MRIFNFAFLSVATAPHNVPTPYISKTHLPILSLNVRELELNWCSKDQSKKEGAPNPLLGGSASPNPQLHPHPHPHPHSIKKIKFERVWGKLESKKVSKDNTTQNISD